MKPKLFLFILLSNIAWAQLPEFKLLSDEEGLRANSVYDAVVDSKSKFWIATDNGLFRFDGSNFIHITYKMGIYRTAAIRKIYMSDDELILIYENTGCISLSLKTFTPKLLTNEKVADVCKLEESLYVLLDNGKLQKKVRKKLQDIYDFNINDIGYGSLHQYNNILYMAIPSKGFFYLKKNKLKLLYPTDIGGYHEKFVSRNNDFFYIYSGAVKKLRPTKSEFLANISSFIKLDGTGYLNDLSYIDNHSAYLLISRRKLFKFVNDSYTEINLPYHDLELIKIVNYDNNKIYICTNQGLLKVNTVPAIKSSAFIDMPKNNQTLNRVRRKIIDYKDKLYLLGYKNIRTDKSNHQKFKYLNLNFSVYDGIVLKEKLYLATEGAGLQVYDFDRDISKKVPLDENIPDNFLCSLAKTDDEREIYAGGFGCLYNIISKDNAYVKIEIPYRNKFVLSILPDVNDNVLIGTEEGILIVDGHTKEVIKKNSINENLRGKRISSLRLDKKRDLLWVGHENGIDILDSKTYHNIRKLDSSLFLNPKIACIEQDGKNNIWASTFSEIIGYNFEMDRIVRFTKKNGLINSEFNYKSSAVLSDKRIIFGGLSGYDVINTDYDYFHKAKKRGAITGYNLINRNNTKYFEFKNGSNYVNFNGDINYIQFFISPSSFPCNRNSYQTEYRLNKENWIVMSSKFTLELTNITEGEHELEFRSFDSYGSTISYDPIHLKVSTSFYKTKTFISIMFIIVLIAVTGAFVYKLLLNKKEAVMKTMIAMDLHDDIGSVVTRLKILSQTNSVITGDLRSNIISNLDYLNFNLKNYIHTFNNNNNLSILSLYDDIVELYKNNLVLQNIDFKFIIEKDNDFIIKANFFKDLKLCMFEVINNCVKHSQAKQLILNFKITKEGFTITITDDGVLESIQKLVDKGNGINNLKKRIKRNNASIDFAIAGLHGLIITITYKT